MKPNSSQIDTLSSHPITFHSEAPKAFGMLKSGFWAPKWSDAKNIWVPIGYYANQTSHLPPRDFRDPHSGGEHHSNPIVAHPKVPDNLLKSYITCYIHEMWGVDVKDYTSYIHALTHKSYQSEKLVEINNERLEFLGDSVLQIVITEYIYNRFPKKSEGFLTKIRMKLINGTTLAELGAKLQLQKMIRVSPRLHNINKKLIEDAFEAIICVMYQEHGLLNVSKVLINLYETHINFEELIIDNNYKELLLKHVQRQKQEPHTDKLSNSSSSNNTPIEYVIIDSVGPSHSKLFRVQVVHDNKRLGVGMGTTRRAGEQAAARETLTILGANHNTMIDS